MNLTFDRNLFTQTTLDSGALTMLGGVTHTLSEAGQYRGMVYRNSEGVGAFYIDCRKDSAVAQANIDLAGLDPTAIRTARSQGAGIAADCGCAGASASSAANTFTVHPKGYLVFHVSGGSGGYSVIVRKADEDPNTALFDTRKLSTGDIFSAAIIRPGVYSVKNALTTAEASITVLYPKRTAEAYRPPKPVTFECGSRGIEPRNSELQPGQGIHFHFAAPSRITIELVKPDDGPDRPLAPRTQKF